MRIVSRWIAAVLLSAAGAAAVLAQVPALDVKMGLWEITSNTDMSGQVPGLDTSKMTPDQRVQIEAVMKNMAGARPIVTKTCITKEKFGRSSFVTDQPGTTCKQNITTNTSSTLEGSLSCSGARTMTGQMHIDAPSSTSINASVKWSMAEQGRGMSVNSTISGKWLSADCGTTKP